MEGELGLSDLSIISKDPMNSTFTDSNIPIHALTTIRLFAKQIIQ